jgi:hypothetical protein
MYISRCVYNSRRKNIYANKPNEFMSPFKVNKWVLTQVIEHTHTYLMEQNRRLCIFIILLPVTVAERSRVYLSSLAWKPGLWVRIPLRAWIFSVCVCVCVFLCLCTNRDLATSWSPVQGVLPTVPDQETEKTPPYAPKAGASSQVWEQRGGKTNHFTTFILIFSSYVSHNSRRLHKISINKISPYKFHESSNYVSY